jgi:hypothetical protein
MPTLIAVLGLVVAVVAGVRSTWSPCGLSMLSTITPFGERSRGHRYAATAGWFVVGATLGGASLGAVAAGLAAGVSATGTTGAAGWVAAAAVAAGGAAAVDAGVLGPLMPLWRRQVDDGWLTRYRSWVYGAGFGWQIGVGVATYIMTAAVFLLVILAALTGDPLVAVGICTLFGLVRGLAVLCTARADSPAGLRAMHRRFDQVGPAVRVGVIVLEATVGALLLAAEWSRAGLVVVAVLAGLGAVWAAGSVVSRTRRAGAERAVVSRAGHGGVEEGVSGGVSGGASVGGRAVQRIGVPGP